MVLQKKIKFFCGKIAVLASSEMFFLLNFHYFAWVLKKYEVVFNIVCSHSPIWGNICSLIFELNDIQPLWIWNVAQESGGKLLRFCSHWAQGKISNSALWVQVLEFTKPVILLGSTNGHQCAIWIGLYTSIVPLSCYWYFCYVEQFILNQHSVFCFVLVIENLLYSEDMTFVYSFL